MKADPATPSVPAVERALAILELIAQSRSGLTLSEIVRGLKFPKSSAHCLLLTLERQGYMMPMSAGGLSRKSARPVTVS